MRKYLILSMVILLFSQTLLSQKDSLIVKEEKPLIVKIAFPTALILTGALLTGKQVEKNWQTDIRNKVGHNYRVHTDDYIQYIPYAQIYLGDVVGINAKNHWFDQTKNIFIGGLATLVITHSLKRGVGKERPDGSSNHSFSSGHTATAFLGATINYHEYQNSSMLYASSGFLFSTSTAGLRVANNRHWVSDVVAGAGIGILVGNLIYHIEPLKNFNPFKKSKNISFTPIVDDKGFSFTAALQF